MGEGGIRTFQRTGRNIASALQFAKALVDEFLTFRPDVVHLHSSFAGAIGRSLIFLLRPWHKAKVIYCPHAFSFLIPSVTWKQAAYALIERALLPLTDRVICISEYELRQAMFMGLPEGKLQLIENGAEPVAETGENPYEDGPINVLFVGRFDRQKGFDILLKAMADLEGTPIVLTAVGSGVHDSSAYAPICNVRYAGWLSPEALAPYYRFADVLVVPSRWEGFGLVVVEAASVGVPALASRCCSFSSLIEDGITGLLFEPEDAVEIAEKLRSIHKSEWRQMGIAAKSRYFRHYTSERMVEHTHLLYIRLTEVCGSGAIETA